MIRTDLLQWQASKNGYSFEDVAELCGMDYNDFLACIWRGVFDSDKIQTMIEKLKIDDIKAFFFYPANRDEEQDERIYRKAICEEIL